MPSFCLSSYESCTFEFKVEMFFFSAGVWKLLQLMWTRQWFVKSAALLCVYNESVSNEENQCLQLKCQRWSSKTPGVVSPLNYGKTETFFTFMVVWWLDMRCFSSPTKDAVCCISVVTRAWAWDAARRYWNSLLFIYFSSRSCDFRLHRPNEFKAPTLIYNAVSFLPGLADEIFGFIWLNYGNYFSFFFCLKGNAVLLIKPGSKLVLQLSGEAEQSDGTIKVSADNYRLSGIFRCTT